MTAKTTKEIGLADEDWPLDERPGFLARRMHQIHVSIFAELCGRYGVTPVQYSLMTAIERRGSADQTTVARDIALDRTTTTGALKRLISKGYVSRTVSSGDRRSQECSLTAVGCALLTSMEGAARRAHEVTIETLSASERAQLIDLLRRVVDGHRARSADLDLV